MTALIRRAVKADVKRLGVIRSALSPFSAGNRGEAGSAATHSAPGARGFLLGSSESTYEAYVSNDTVLVAEARNEVVAYSVVLPDAVLRRSDIYAKRHHAHLEPALLALLERSNVAYFDQLASLPGHGFAAVHLAYRHLLETLRSHDAVLATTVVAPVENLHAVPLLRGMGFKPVGLIDEVYPEAGPIRSRVYLADRAAVAAARRSPLAIRFERRIAFQERLPALEPV
jgi:hypothetical protein